LRWCDRRSADCARVRSTRCESRVDGGSRRCLRRKRCLSRRRVRWRSWPRGDDVGGRRRERKGNGGGRGRGSRKCLVAVRRHRRRRLPSWLCVLRCRMQRGSRASYGRRLRHDNGVAQRARFHPPLVLLRRDWRGYEFCGGGVINMTTKEMQTQGTNSLFEAPEPTKQLSSWGDRHGRQFVHACSPFDCLR
jgi:hypothetical protein